MKVLCQLLLTVCLSRFMFPAVFTVTSTTGNASYDSPTANNGTFAGAILAINATGTGNHTIAFAIPGAGPHTINLGGMTATLATNSNLTIDGCTQSGAVCGSDLRILFDGNWANFIISNQTNLLLKGLIFNSALTLSSCTNASIHGCFFNMNNTGTAGSGSVVGGSQLTLSACVNCQIGGMAAGEGNVFSGSTGGGTNYTNCVIVSGSNGLKFYKNLLGTNRMGTGRLGQLTGVVMDISASSSVEIAGNVISASKGTPGHGILVSAGNCNGLRIQNNYIGLDINGNGLSYSNPATLGNWGSGIAVLAGTVDNMMIDNNCIGANRNYGIHLKVNHSGVQITHNKIGLPSTGIYSAGADVGNGYSGICLEGISSTNLLVSNNSIARNGWLSSAPSDQKETCGIVFQYGSVVSATITGNKIGVDQSLNPAGNEFTGLYFFSCGNMGGSNAANVLVNNNIIGDNGESIGAAINSHGIAAYRSSYFTISGNYVGVGPAGENIGNSANGMEMNEASQFIIQNNQVANNKGRRTTSDAEACAGIAMFNSTDGQVFGNAIYNHANAGGGFIPNNGIFVQRGGNIRIGGMSAGQPNAIYSNGTHGIAVFDGADFVEMRFNSIYCNADKGINIGCSGSVFGKPSGNNSFGCGTLSISPTPPALPASITGNRPANSLVDVFGTNACASSTTCISQGQYRYAGGIYTPSTQGVPGTTWTYNNGVSMYNDLSALATGGGSDCNGSSVCRTSEFSPCVDNPLPIHLLSIQARYVAEKVEVNWLVRETKNVHHFLVERSSDATTFEPIGVIEIKNENARLSSFQFFDELPLAGRSYYRITQVDNDERWYPSAAVPVSIQTTTFQVLPNPSNGNVLIRAVPQAFIFITDACGRRVLERTMQDEWMMWETGLPAGIYLVNCHDGMSVRTEKLMVE